MTPREIAREKLQDQRLPPLVLEIFDGSVALVGLDFRCQSPHHVWSAAPESLQDFVPMWECGVVATGLDLSDGRFVKLSLENPDAPGPRFAKFSQLVADLLVDLWEDEIENSALEELAMKFEFDGLERLLTELEQGSLDNGRSLNDADYPEWRLALVRSF